jgi:hypothetical protein
VLALLCYSAFPRYEWHQVQGALFVRVDRWRGRLERGAYGNDGTWVSFTEKSQRDLDAQGRAADAANAEQARRDAVTAQIEAAKRGSSATKLPPISLDDVEPVSAKPAADTPVTVRLADGTTTTVKLSDIDDVIEPVSGRARFLVLMSGALGGAGGVWLLALGKRWFRRRNDRLERQPNI